jgi:hypothetical protein
MKLRKADMLRDFLHVDSTSEIHESYLEYSINGLFGISGRFSRTDRFSIPNS